jgi:hypothetical protein
MLFAIPAFLGIELPEAEVGRCSWATIIIYNCLKLKKLHKQMKIKEIFHVFSSSYFRLMFFFHFSGCDKFIVFCFYLNFG